MSRTRRNPLPTPRGGWLNDYDTTMRRGLARMSKDMYGWEVWNPETKKARRKQLKRARRIEDKKIVRSGSDD